MEAAEGPIRSTALPIGAVKDWRRIATRYDRLARNFLSAVALVATAWF
jgi:transposase